MLIFIGERKIVKECGPTYPIKCKYCNNNEYLHLMVLEVWFAIFFIPVIPYKPKYFLQCPSCSNSKRIKGYEIKKAKEINKITTSYLNKEITEAKYKATLRNALENNEQASHSQKEEHESSEENVDRTAKKNSLVWNKRESVLQGLSNYIGITISADTTIVSVLNNKNIIVFEKQYLALNLTDSYNQILIIKDIRNQLRQMFNVEATGVYISVPNCYTLKDRLDLQKLFKQNGFNFVRTANSLLASFVSVSSKLELL